MEPKTPPEHDKDTTQVTDFDDAYLAIEGDYELDLKVITFIITLSFTENKVIVILAYQADSLPLH